jgi:stress response protein YsnF
VKKFQLRRMLRCGILPLPVTRTTSAGFYNRKVYIMSGTRERIGFPVFDALLNVQRSYIETFTRMPFVQASGRASDMGRITETVMTTTLAPVEAMTQLATESVRRYTDLTRVFFDYAREATESARSVVVRSSSNLPVPVENGREQVLPIGEERLRVGKQIVEGERTRAVRRVVETPVEERVELVTNTVVVERRQPRRHEGGNVLSEQVVELASTSERPIVSKGIELVEEVVLRHETTARVETIRDTLRRDVVSIEQQTRVPAVIPQRADKREDKRGGGDAARASA